MNTESTDNQAGNNKLIGSQVSLVTKAESRYEGTLVEVDRVKKTMTLKNVKNMGTEGRRDGVNEIPASENIMG
jgi:protein LSM14